GSRSAGAVQQGALDRHDGIEALSDNRARQAHGTARRRLTETAIPEAKASGRPVGIGRGPAVGEPHSGGMPGGAGSVDQTPATTRISRTTASPRACRALWYAGLS